MNKKLLTTPLGVNFPDDDESFHYRTDEINTVPNRRIFFSKLRQ